MNTKKRGKIRYLIFQVKDGDFCAICLDFDLIEWGQNKDELLASIQEAGKSYLKGVIEKDLPDELLNRPAPAKYWKMLEKQSHCFTVKPTQEITRFSNQQFFGFESSPYNDRFIFA